MAFRNHAISRKLRIRLWFLLVVSLVLCGVVLLRTAQGVIGIPWAFLALLAGLGLGLLTNRMFRLEWDEAHSEVVRQIDGLVGAVILVLYLIFSLLKGQLIGHWVADADTASVAGLALTAGAMIARLAGSVTGIRHLLATLGIESGG